MDNWLTELSIKPQPNSVAARIAATPPLGSKLSSEPIGARQTGNLNFFPKITLVASILRMSLKTRGRNAMASNAILLRLSVVSVSVPPRK